MSQTDLDPVPSQSQQVCYSLGLFSVTPQVPLLVVSTVGISDISDLGRYFHRFTDEFAIICRSALTCLVPLILCLLSVAFLAHTADLWAESELFGTVM